MFQLFGTPRSARHDPLSPSPADQRIVQSPPAQVYSAAEYWRRHKEEERKVEEEMEGNLEEGGGVVAGAGSVKSSAGTSIA